MKSPGTLGSIITDAQEEQMKASLKERSGLLKETTASSQKNNVHGNIAPTTPKKTTKLLHQYPELRAPIGTRIWIPPQSFYDIHH